MSYRLVGIGYCRIDRKRPSSEQIRNVSMAQCGMICSAQAPRCKGFGWVPDTCRLQLDEPTTVHEDRRGQTLCYVRGESESTCRIVFSDQHLGQSRVGCAVVGQLLCNLWPVC